MRGPDRCTAEQRSKKSMTLPGFVALSSASRAASKHLGLPSRGEKRKERDGKRCGRVHAVAPAREIRIDW